MLLRRLITIRASRAAHSAPAFEPRAQDFAHDGLHRGAQDRAPSLSRISLLICAQAILSCSTTRRSFPHAYFPTMDKIELLFLEQLRQNAWKCMVKPGRKMKLGKTYQSAEIFWAKSWRYSRGGERVMLFEACVDFDSVGHLPIPPYIAARAMRVTPNVTRPFMRRTGRDCRTDCGSAFHAGNLRADSACIRHASCRRGHLQAGSGGEHRRPPDAFGAVCGFHGGGSSRLMRAQRIVAIGTTRCACWNHACCATEKFVHRKARRIFSFIRRMNSVSWMRC